MYREIISPQCVLSVYFTILLIPLRKFSFTFAAITGGSETESVRVLGTLQLVNLGEDEATKPLKVFLDAFRSSSNNNPYLPLSSSPQL